MVERTQSAHQAPSVRFRIHLRSGLLPEGNRSDSAADALMISEA